MRHASAAAMLTSKFKKFPCVAKAHVTGNRRWARRQSNKAYCHRTISCPTNSRCTQCEIVQPIAGSLLYFLCVISEFQLLFLTEFHPSSKSYFDCSFLIISEAQNSFPSAVSFKTRLLHTTPKILHHKNFTSR